MNDILLTPIRLNEFEALIQNSIRKVLSESTKQNHLQSELDQLLSIQQAAELLNLSVSTIYGLVSRSEVPCMKKGKRLYFSEQELIKWIKTGRKKTVAEIQDEVDIQLSTKNKRR